MSLIIKLTSKKEIVQSLKECGHAQSISALITKINSKLPTLTYSQKLETKILIFDYINLIFDYLYNPNVDIKIYQKTEKKILQKLRNIMAVSDLITVYKIIETELNSVLDFK